MLAVFKWWLRTRLGWEKRRHLVINVQPGYLELGEHTAAPLTHQMYSLRKHP